MSRPARRRLAALLSPLLTLLAVLALAAPGTAAAAVTIAFYSHEFGDRFPHAFVTLKGTLETTGEVVDANYGFTARTVSPAILFGSVDGVIERLEPDYIAASDRQIALTIDDATYARVMETVEAWRAGAKKGYNLNRRNCVHFVAELARIVGLTTRPDSRFFKKPRSFLLELSALNEQRLATARGM